jgi:hypothetical protein
LYATLYFKEADGFDERLFVYFGEVDFSVRAREAGWSASYLATAQCSHSGCGRSPDDVNAGATVLLSLEQNLLWIQEVSNDWRNYVTFDEAFHRADSRDGQAIVRGSMSQAEEVALAYLPVR